MNTATKLLAASGVLAASFLGYSLSTASPRTSAKSELAVRGPVVYGERLVPIALLARAGLSVKGEMLRGTKYGDTPHPEIDPNPPFVHSRAVGFDSQGQVEVLLTCTVNQDMTRQESEPGAFVNDLPKFVGKTPPSGLQFAKDSRYQASPGCRRVFFYGEYEAGYLQITRKYMRTATGKSVLPEWDAEPFEPVLEAAARTYFARIVAERLEPADDRQVAGRPVRTWRCVKSGIEYVALEEWAEARGFAQGGADTVPCVTLRHHGAEVVVPLGAMAVRLGDRWLDLPDCVAEKDGRWLVPLEIDRLVP
ncbi:MAG: hypothetical protein IT207_10145 [Fimbriimonadaceae bacterium]|nr:hypothetical protein [Fimbriimonadaceae bacterium]